MEYKKIWRRNEDPSMVVWNDFCDRLHSLIPEIRAEFMRHFQSITDRLDFDGMRVVVDDYFNTLHSDSQDDDLDGWKAVLLKFKNVVDGTEQINPDLDTKFPTIASIINEYGDNCTIAFYSCMAPQTVLERHTGPENKEGKYIRVHVPLIIPKGELFMEIKDEFVTWDNIFCFDNQYVHSSHNHSDEWRLILLIDFLRESIGIPPGLPYDEERSGDTSVRYDKYRNIIPKI